MPLTVEIAGIIPNKISADVDVSVVSTVTGSIDAKSSTGESKYVPFRLISSQRIQDIEDSQMDSKSFREMSKMYVDSNNTNYRVSLQQIKSMSTKIITTETSEETDEKIHNLDTGDYIYEKI